MAKNPNALATQESKNAQQPTKTEWGELEELGEFKEIDFEGENSPMDKSDQQTFQHRKEAIKQSRQKIEDIFEDTSTPFVPTQDLIDSSMSDAPTAKSSSRSKNIVGRLLSGRRTKQIKTLTNPNSRLKEKRKAVKLIEDGKVDLDDPTIIDAYIRFKLSNNELVTEQNGQKRGKTYIEKIEDMQKVGINPEKSVMELTDIFTHNINEILSKDYSWAWLGDFKMGQDICAYDQVTLAEITEISNKYDLPQIKELIQDKVDIQAFGDVATYACFKDIYAFQQREKNPFYQERFESIQKNFSFLKEIGYTPFKNGVGIDLLFKRGDPEETQNAAMELGLIDGKVVDSMYHYKLNTLNKALAKYCSLPEMHISETLKCSGEDDLALFLEQCQAKTGEDELENIAKRAEQNRYYSVAIEVAKEFCEPDNQENGFMNLVLNNPDDFSGPDKGFILALKDAAKTDNTESADSLLQEVLKVFFIESAGKGSKKSMELIFDENGISDLAKESAIFGPPLFKNVIQKFNPNWATHFSEDIQKIIDSDDNDQIAAFKNQPELLDELSPMRRTAVELAIRYPECSKIWSLKNKDLSEITQYFDENGVLGSKLTQELVDNVRNDVRRNIPCDVKDIEPLATAPEIYAHLSRIDRQYFDILPKINLSKQVLEFSDEEKAQYFDENGPKPEFWQYEFFSGDLSAIESYLEETATTDKNGNKIFDYDALSLSEKQIETLRVYSEIDREDKREGVEGFIASLENLDNIPLSRIKVMPQVLDRLYDSNSDEMRTGAFNLTAQLLSLEPDSDEAIFEKIDKIEEIYLKNNLPYVGKAFRTFTILHPPESWGVETSSDSVSMRATHGILANLPNQGIHSRVTVLWSAFLKTAIGSNDLNFKRYLDSLESPEHIKTLADNTAKARAEGSNPDAFKPDARHSVADRIVRSFAYGLGYKSFDQLKEDVERIPAEADRRNRERLRAKDFSLQKGDLVKSTAIEHLGSMLEKGVFCKEGLNGQAPSDGTPLDADCGIFEKDFDSISDAIDHKNATNAFGAMHCILVMKGDENSGRNRFRHEGDDEPYDPNKYEIWDAYGENHGVMVGFPKSEIDFIIYDDLGEKDIYGDLNRIKFEVARTGPPFIPIVDKNTGEPVFTEEEYDELRQRMSGLSRYEMGEFIAAPSKEMDLGSMSVNGKQIPSTQEIMAASQGNREEVDQKRNAITKAVFGPFLQEFGLEYKPYIDGDITEGSAEIIDTGSTGRYSNAPHDGDFDFMMKLDNALFTSGAKMDEIRDNLLESMGITDPEKKREAIKDGNIRVKGVKLEGIKEPLDIDITFSQKTNQVQYSTDMALKDFYESMTPEVREQVAANVVYAKAFLKAFEVYKPNRGDIPQGGLGGVGVENWIIQNGGSFLAAAKDFLITANECTGFDEFKGKYAVWDFGENHKPRKKTSHDNFITDNMSGSGYINMKQALTVLLEKFDPEFLAGLSKKDQGL